MRICVITYFDKQIHIHEKRQHAHAADGDPRMLIYRCMSHASSGVSYPAPMPRRLVAVTTATDDSDAAQARLSCFDVRSCWFSSAAGL